VGVAGKLGANGAALAAVRAMAGDWSADAEADQGDTADRR
jgi:hypothetical protein